jgi:predicted Zn-dependent protease
MENLDLSSLVESSVKVYKSVSKAKEDINSEQEYYIGRTVAAQIYSKYRPYNDKASHLYINKIGKTLAYNSNAPETFSGYHFAILDSNEINAFAAPGGFIFVTRGMLKLCDSEDAIASVLAHEIAHIEHKHGISTIKKSRLTSAVTTIGKEGSKHFGDEKLQEITNNFGDSIEDIMNTLVVNGYSRSYEYDADQTALQILKRTGYNQSAMVDMLQKMQKRLQDDTFGFGSTHPKAAKRIENIKPLIEDNIKSIPNNRNKRFRSHMKYI